MISIEFANLNIHEKTNDLFELKKFLKDKIQMSILK